MIPPSSESATRERDAAAAVQSEAALCCPVGYDPQHLPNDPYLWSGRVSGACTEEGFLTAFKQVLDDDGHALERGKRHAVCGKTFNLYQ